MTMHARLTAWLRLAAILLAAALLADPIPAGAQFMSAAPGWQRHSVYNQKYDPRKYETLKGYLTDFREVKPMPGMAPGLALDMRTNDGRKVTVHLGPMDFVGYLEDVLETGDRIKVKGAFARIAGENVFMASKLRRKEMFELKFRSTSRGTPYWDMSKAEMFEETLEE